jgi:hypothetical protein
LTLQHLTVLPTEFFILCKTRISSVINLPTKSRWKCSVYESFIGNFLFVGKSVGNKKKILLPMDLLTEQARKKNYSFHSVGISSKNTIGNFVGNYLKTFLKNPFYKIIK